MRSQLLLTLPALAVADAWDQKPMGSFSNIADAFKNLYKQAQAFIPTQNPIGNPVQAAAAAIVNLAVTPLTINNYKSVLLSSEPPKATGEPDEWLIYVSGGNKTCYGRCENATHAWNASTALLAAQAKGPKLASIDCETDGVLCAAWSVTPPLLAQFLIPRDAAADTTVRYLPLNTTTVSAKSIVDMQTHDAWQRVAPYSGLFHPFNGILATTGANIPYGYAVWAFAQMPSWLPMILISFISRSFM
jgi:hypothetical protein